MLNPDDVSAGQFVTVREWVSQVDYSYVGNILKVTAVDLPFVAVDRYLSGGLVFSTLILDTRQVNLVRLKPCFVSAVLDGSNGGAQSISQQSQPATPEQSAQQAVG